MSDTTGWIIYVLCLVWLLYLAFNEHKKRSFQRMDQLNVDQHAHCDCGETLSEWFLHEGLMWHPAFVRGCGWISPWTDHADYRENQNVRQASKRWQP